MEIRLAGLEPESIVDGPGYRFTVFVQGCPHDCPGCHNPQTHDFSGGHIADTDDVIARWGPNPLVRGLTLSGGEATAQPEFAEALLRTAKEQGIHTAIETTGFAPEGVLLRLCRVLDLWMMDIKHMDSAKHQEFTTKPNEQILQNARLIAEHGQELIIRVPVIPTFNDTEEEIAAIARFANSLPGVQRLHLLPYHRLGQDKYTGLGRPYGMGDLPLLTKETMQRLLNAAQEASGLLCQIGG